MYPLAIDVGTTNIKLHVFEKENLLDKLSIPIDTYREDDGRVYQSPERIWNKIKRGIRSLTQKGYQIDSVVLSTAMHSIMPVFDNNSEDELYIWQDRQGQEFIESFKRDEDYLSVYKKTGTPIHEMSPFAKIGSFQRKPWFQDVRKWVSLKDYLMNEFTGEWVLDYSIASATGLFNIHDKQWDEEILEMIDVKRHQLSRLVDTDYYAPLLDHVAEELFLKEGIPVFIGASDGCLASYASYVANGTLNTLTIGTSAAVRKLSKEIELDDLGQTFCYYLNENYWVIGAASNNGGQIMTWADKTFYDGHSIFKHLNQLLDQTNIGSDGLLFFPYLSGERAPSIQQDINGSFTGLTMCHTKNHFIRSVVEGIFYNLRYISELVALDSREITISGGFFQNDILTMMASDIFGRNVIQSVYGEPTFGGVSLVTPLKTYLLSDYKRTFYSEESHQLYNKTYDKYVEELEKNYLELSKD